MNIFIEPKFSDIYTNWIVIDAISVYLYFSRDLHLTSLLFMTYTIIAIFGFFNWLKMMQKDA